MGVEKRKGLEDDTHIDYWDIGWRFKEWVELKFRRRSMSTEPVDPESDECTQINPISVYHSKRSAWVSEAISQDLKFLETMLTATGDYLEAMTQQHIFDRYLARIKQQPNHRIQAVDKAKAFDGSPNTWRLIRLAAHHSNEVYLDFPRISPDLILGPYKDFKKTMITIEKVYNRGYVLVVAIRGSMTASDWLVNVDREPVSSKVIHYGRIVVVAYSNLGNNFYKKLLGTTARWHQGFLTVAEEMQARIGEAIIETLETLIDQTGSAEDIDLIFTGHSAGGAIARLFYAMCTSPNHTIGGITFKFRRIHCIVFGAPPLTTSPIPQPQYPPFRSGLFLNIVNEGDPIALIQQEYFNALLQIMRLDAEDMEDQFPNGFLVPDPVFRVSGPCVILRDNDPDFMDMVGWNAVMIEAEVLERKIFGNPSAHHMEDYLRRIESIEELMVSRCTTEHKN
ncbi:Alpha/Beta hydrolase protein [Xylogone sp. PMI_703]|nr:Alpha/Beta hydrolase protein [Xylogone sp. PMI_703]